jgi:hypothetical protein
MFSNNDEVNDIFQNLFNGSIPAGGGIEVFVKKENIEDLIEKKEEYFQKIIFLKILKEDLRKDKVTSIKIIESMIEDYEYFINDLERILKPMLNLKKV